MNAKDRRKHIEERLEEIILSSGDIIDLTKNPQLDKIDYGTMPCFLVKRKPEFEWQEPQQYLVLMHHTKYYNGNNLNISKFESLHHNCTKNRVPLVNIFSLYEKAPFLSRESRNLIVYRDHMSEDEIDMIRVLSEAERVSNFFAGNILFYFNHTSEKLEIWKKGKNAIGNYERSSRVPENKKNDALKLKYRFVMSKLEEMNSFMLFPYYFDRFFGKKTFPEYNYSAMLFSNSNPYPCKDMMDRYKAYLNRLKKINKEDLDRVEDINERLALMGL